MEKIDAFLLLTFGIGLLDDETLDYGEFILRPSFSIDPLQGTEAGTANDNLWGVDEGPNAKNTVCESLIVST